MCILEKQSSLSFLIASLLIDLSPDEVEVNVDILEHANISLSQISEIMPHSSK